MHKRGPALSIQLHVYLEGCCKATTLFPIDHLVYHFLKYNLMRVAGQGQGQGLGWDGLGVGFIQFSPSSRKMLSEISSS